MPITIVQAGQHDWLRALLSKQGQQKSNWSARATVRVSNLHLSFRFGALPRKHATQSRQPQWPHTTKAGPHGPARAHARARVGAPCGTQVNTAC